MKDVPYIAIIPIHIKINTYSWNTGDQIYQEKYVFGIQLLGFNYDFFVGLRSNLFRSMWNKHTLVGITRKGYGLSAGFMLIL